MWERKALHACFRSHSLILSKSDRYVIWWLYNAGLKIGTMEQDMFICLPHEDCNMTGSRRQTMHNKNTHRHTTLASYSHIMHQKKCAFNYFTLISFIHFWLHSHSSSIWLSVIIFCIYAHTNHQNILEIRIINQIFRILFP